MGPEACLQRANSAYLNAEWSECFEALADYANWRKSGGFEPAEGDARAAAIRNEARECIYESTTDALTELFKALVPEIADDYYASVESEPGTMSVTVGMDADSADWSYQTGDNSYTGGAYGYAYWGVVELHQGMTAGECKQAALVAVDEIAEQIAQCD